MIAQGAALGPEHSEVFSPERARLAQLDAWRAPAGLWANHQSFYPGLRPGLSQRGPMGLNTKEWNSYLKLKTHSLAES
jgi:hypothetical protein